MELKYNGTIYRPPIEAYTLLLPVTEGCSHNRCRFCNMYKNIKFRILGDNEIENWLEEVRRVNGAICDEIDRIYLIGADPFAISAKKLENVIELIKKYLPNIKIVTMYAAIRNIMSKTDEQLKKLKNLSVNDLYVGIESGLDDVLIYHNKGNSVDDIREQCARLNRIGIRHFDMLMPGAAGKGRGIENALANAKLLNEIKPETILLTTISPFKGTKLYEDVENGKFETAGETEILTEEKILLENLNLPETYFWAALSLDSVRIAGKLREKREEMIKILEKAIKNIDDEKFKKTFKRHHL